MWSSDDQGHCIQASADPAAPITTVVYMHHAPWHRGVTSDECGSLKHSPLFCTVVLCLHGKSLVHQSSRAFSINHVRGLDHFNSTVSRYIRSFLNLIILLVTRYSLHTQYTVQVSAF